MRDLVAIAAPPRLEPDAGRGAASPSWRASLVWLLIAISSIVFVEPAPYDILAIGALAAFLLTGAPVPSALAAPLLLVMLFVAANYLAAAVSEDPAATLRSVGIRTYLCGTVLLFACAVASAPRNMLRALWSGYAVAAAIAVVWGGLQYFGYIALPEGWFRARGPFKDPNVFGPFLVPVALWCMESVWQRRGALRVLYAGLFGGALFGILISFSRGAWLNLFVAGAAYFALRVFVTRASHTRRNAVVGAIALLAFAAGLISVAATSPRFADQFVNRARLFQEYDVAATGRFAAQGRALQSAAEHPLGIGPGRAADEFGLEPHNLYLHVFAEGGWIAGLAFLSFVGLTLARSIPLVRRPWTFQCATQIALAALGGVLAQSFFIDSTHWRHLYLLFGVLWGLIAVGSRTAAYDAP